MVNRRFQVGNMVLFSNAVTKQPIHGLIRLIGINNQRVGESVQPSGNVLFAICDDAVSNVINALRRKTL